MKIILFYVLHMNSLAICDRKKKIPKPLSDFGIFYVCIEVIRIDDRYFLRDMGGFLEPDWPLIRCL